MGNRGSAQPVQQEGQSSAITPVLTSSPVAVASTSDADVQVSVVLSRASALVGLRQTVHALLQIRTPAPQRARLPLHVACVMDRSGSMRGAKLKFAKRGVRKLIKHLNVEDALHLVTYDHAVKRVFVDGDLTVAGKEDLVQQVKNVATGGTTNLCGGLEEGVASLMGSRQAGTQEVASRRVCLFSDGLVNSGVTDKADILNRVRNFQAKGITVATFGIGTDFDEELMRRIAQEGRGDYAFLETAESIPRLVSKSVHGLLSLAGTEAILEVRGLNGAVVTKVYGCGDDDEDEDGLGAAGTLSSMPGLLRIGDLHASNVKQVLVELELSPSGEGGAPPQDVIVLEYGLRYSPCSSGEEAGSQGSEDMSQGVGAPRLVGGTASLALTNDRASLGEVNPEVAVAVALQEAVSQEGRVMELLEQGKKADAIAMKEAVIDRLMRLHSDLTAGGAPEDVCHRLEKAVGRSSKTLESMRSESRDRRAMMMELRYERDIQERLSDDAYSEGCDSDASDWSCSDEGDAPQRRQNNGTSGCNPQDSDGSDSITHSGMDTDSDSD
mmetsp:Transcript_75541/g.179465  ORF Transcript_75541/g.179465 Transcript_75541/m.179465 type:complete len:553 (-) Transcript_75541:261-1919(-)